MLPSEGDDRCLSGVKNSAGRAAPARFLALLPVFLALGLVATRQIAWGAFWSKPDPTPAAPSGAVVSEEPIQGVRVHFTTPQDLPAWEGWLDGLLVLDLANRSIDVAAYDLDLQTVTEALLRAWSRGVRVRVVMESDNLRSDQARQLLAAGIPVLGDDRSAAMHNKFVVVDDQITWTGSWNLTESCTYRNNNDVAHIVSAAMAAIDAWV